jgi:hypothetical protein
MKYPPTNPNLVVEHIYETHKVEYVLNVKRYYPKRPAHFRDYIYVADTFSPNSKKWRRSFKHYGTRKNLNNSPDPIIQQIISDFNADHPIKK